MRLSIRFAVVLSIVVSLFLSGCNTLQRIQTGELTTTFDRIFLVYSKHLRWNHFRELTTFMMPEHIGPALEKIDQLSDVKVSRVTPVAWLISGQEDDDDDQDTVMTGDVVIDYYLASTSTIRSVTQRQIWRHDSENDTWRLDNGLPDFRL